MFFFLDLAAADAGGFDCSGWCLQFPGRRKGGWSPDVFFVILPPAAQGLGGIDKARVCFSNFAARDYWLLGMNLALACALCFAWSFNGMALSLMIKICFY